MRIAAIIPARGGSKGIPNKNLELLNGKPLIYHAIMLAAQVADLVMVTSDSALILSIADEIMPSIKLHNRCSELAGDEVPLDPVLVDACYHIEADAVVTLLPTCPFVSPETVRSALKRYSSVCPLPVVACLRSHEVAWRDGVQIGERMNRQAAVPLLIESAAFSICSRKNLRHFGTRYYAVPVLHEVSKLEAFDIDEPKDLELARRIAGGL